MVEEVKAGERAVSVIRAFCSSSSRAVHRKSQRKMPRLTAHNSDYTYLRAEISLKLLRTIKCWDEWPPAGLLS